MLFPPGAGGVFDDMAFMLRTGRHGVQSLDTLSTLG